jgi:pimeloyl-ACP methyl ester carboxylesterase
MCNCSVQYEQKFVRIGDHEISTIICSPPQSGSGGSMLRAEEPPLVLLHGWGGAAGMWMRNLPELAAAGNRRVIAIDMLGCGRSSRPVFTQNGVHETEEWWIESVEKWRHAMQIDRMQLCGHSLGGYIAAGYGLKYPARLERLILASPAGVPEPDPVEQEQRRQSRFNGSFGRRMLMKFADAV